MTRQSSSLRKQPVQERSRRTVEIILTAATQVLMAHGYEASTTALVAERAGVSVGTLYQYFPNKESLVGALAQQHVDELLAIVDRAIGSTRDKSLGALIGALIDAGIHAHRIAPALHRVLIEEVPQRSGLRQYLDISGALQERIRLAISARYPAFDANRTEMLAFVIETCIEALTHRAVLETPGWLDDGALVNEINLLLQGYAETATAP